MPMRIRPPARPPADAEHRRQPPRGAQQSPFDDPDAVSDECVGERVEAERRLEEQIEAEAGNEARRSRPPPARRGTRPRARRRRPRSGATPAIRRCGKTVTCTSTTTTINTNKRSDAHQPPAVVVVVVRRRRRARGRRRGRGGRRRGVSRSGPGPAPRRAPRRSRVAPRSTYGFTNTLRLKPPGRSVTLVDASDEEVRRELRRQRRRHDLVAGQDLRLRVEVVDEKLAGTVLPARVPVAASIRDARGCAPRPRTPGSVSTRTFAKLRPTSITEPTTYPSGADDRHVARDARSRCRGRS